MIIKVIMLLLLLMAGLSLIYQGTLHLLSQFFWGNFIELLSISILMVFFPGIYLANLIL
ncbi:hypothetical protein [Anaerobranca gottschalkii]|uniref:Uncharacterized protein n=1 Tax=Anaerobranca gottschalkii DSM 13577 TaxID=1120990 RepID=A0A1I0BS34_9FIRM|nr:hypothetical protein [Anaerobranca gottschalkii]SET09421.1 hypothetical protein SAMN03080614_10474 [Anaerobranca gottschalkii DSM 13577]